MVSFIFILKQNKIGNLISNSGCLPSLKKSGKRVNPGLHFWSRQPLGLLIFIVALKVYQLPSDLLRAFIFLIRPLQAFACVIPVLWTFFFLNFNTFKIVSSYLLCHFYQFLCISALKTVLLLKQVDAKLVFPLSIITSAQLTELPKPWACCPMFFSWIECIEKCHFSFFHHLMLSEIEVHTPLLISLNIPCYLLN